MATERKERGSRSGPVEKRDSSGSRAGLFRPTRALEFADEETFISVLELISQLLADGPLEFDPIDGKTLALPEWSFKRLAPLLGRHQIKFEELEVVPISVLPPEEQARLRGLID